MIEKTMLVRMLTIAPNNIIMYVNYIAKIVTLPTATITLMINMINTAIATTIVSIENTEITIVITLSNDA